MVPYMNSAPLFEAEPMVHPNVLDAYDQAVRALRKARIPFRATGGIALNLHGAGRPTKDVDLIVRRSDWLRAIRVLGQIATDRQGIRFGLPDEPEAGLAVIGPHGIPIEHFQHPAQSFEARNRYPGALRLSQRFQKQTLQLEWLAAFEVDQRRSFVCTHCARALDLVVRELGRNLQT